METAGTMKCRFEEGPVGPGAGEMNHDPSGALHDARGGFDHQRSPSAWLAFAKDFGEFGVVAKPVEQIHGGDVQEQSEEVGLETMTTQAVHLQTILEFIHAMFTLAALDVVIVRLLGMFGCGDVRQIRHNKA
jgi:hypothetical protein